MTTKDKIKLTSYSSGAGWACKLSPDILTQVLSGLNQQLDQNQNYGFENMDDCSIYTLDNGKKITCTATKTTPVNGAHTELLGQ